MKIFLETLLEPLGEAVGAALLFLVVGSTPDYSPKPVAEVSLSIPEYDSIHIEDPDKFLNDLMLSPHWGVTRDRDGYYVANPRPMKDLTGKYNARGFSFIPNPINISGNKANWSTQIIFKQPDQYSRIIESEESVQLPIYESYEDEISRNSYSMVAVKLCQISPIYLTLRESGNDRTRSTTLQVLPLLLKQAYSLANLPQVYEAAEVYSEFYTTYFNSITADFELQRTEGIQGRDNFYGYFRVKNGTNYDGINIKISHPTYCPDEGTRKGNRLRKAEYSGTPYIEDDLVFYLIDDNAVYLSDEYDERFGFFSGNETFEGKIEILNIDQEVLLESKGPFTGWQR